VTIPLYGLPIIDPTGRPPIELASGRTGTGADGSGSGSATSPISLAFNADAGLLELVGLGITVTEWRARQRLKFDLTAWTQARAVVCVDVAAAAGTVLEFQWSATDSAVDSDWATLCSVAIDATGTRVGDWTQLLDGTQADIYLRWVTHA